MPLSGAGRKSSMFVSVVWLIVWLAAPRSVFAARAKLPPVIQAALIVKMIHFGDTIEAAGRDTVRNELTPAGLGTEVLSPHALLNLSGVTAVYLSEDAPLDSVRDFCVRHSILSIGHGVKLAEDGNVSVGIGSSVLGRPEIVISLNRIFEEGHQMSERMFKLARLVK